MKLCDTAGRHTHLNQSHQRGTFLLRKTNIKSKRQNGDIVRHMHIMSEYEFEKIFCHPNTPEFKFKISIFSGEGPGFEFQNTILPSLG